MGISWRSERQWVLRGRLVVFFMVDLLEGRVGPGREIQLTAWAGIVVIVLDEDGITPWTPFRFHVIPP